MPFNRAQAIVILVAHDMEMRWDQSGEECQPQGRERSSGKRIYMPDAIAGKIKALGSEA